MNPEDILTALLVRAIDENVPVEYRSQERRVEDLGPVRGGHEDDPHLGIEPVHLLQELVQRLLALVVPPAGISPKAPRFPEGIELVDEDDAGAEGDYRLSVMEHVKLRVSTEEIDFGAVALGGSVVETVRVTNPGPRAESMSLALAGWNTAEYTLLDAYDSVPAAGHRDVRVRYAPTTAYAGATRFEKLGGEWWSQDFYGGGNGLDGDAFRFADHDLRPQRRVGTGPFDWTSRHRHEITGTDAAAKAGL